MKRGFNGSYRLLREVQGQEGNGQPSGRRYQEQPHHHQGHLSRLRHQDVSHRRSEEITPLL